MVPQVLLGVRRLISQSAGATLCNGITHGVDYRIFCPLPNPPPRCAQGRERRCVPPPRCAQGRERISVSTHLHGYPFPRVRGKVGMGASDGETPTPSPAHCVRKGGSEGVYLPRAVRKGGSAYRYLHISTDTPSPACGGRLTAIRRLAKYLPPSLACGGRLASRATNADPVTPFPRLMGWTPPSCNGIDVPKWEWFQST